MPTSASPRATRSTPGSCRARLRRPLGLPCGPTCAGAAAPSAAGRCLSDSPRYEEDFRQHLRRRRRRPFFFVQAPACPAPSLAPVVLRALARDRAVRVALRLSGDKTNQNGSIGERSNALEIEPERVASERELEKSNSRRCRSSGTAILIRSARKLTLSFLRLALLTITEIDQGRHARARR